MFHIKCIYSIYFAKIYKNRLFLSDMLSKLSSCFHQNHINVCIVMLNIHKFCREKYIFTIFTTFNYTYNVIIIL
ncbi:hypothetical protein V1477_010347 [Vespula maculifrons]|uniref:Uncharacterized protein n=1 Tax=Vespula maculifrons TaxID=7453 RepID=A0ABD2C8A7_VESMC